MNLFLASLALNLRHLRLNKFFILLERPRPFWALSFLNMKKLPVKAVFFCLINRRKALFFEMVVLQMILPALR